MTGFIERLLGSYARDLRRGALLFAYLFLIIARAVLV
jgi:hypothetical protein